MASVKISLGLFTLFCLISAGKVNSHSLKRKRYVSRIVWAKEEQARTQVVSQWENYFATYIVV